MSRSELKKAEGATIAGALTREPEEGARPGERRGWERSFRGPPWMGGVMGFAGLLATAALLLLLAPRFGEAAARRVRSSPWLALVIGFGTIVALPVLAVLLFITILGIPLGIAVLALYPALLLGGFVVGVLFVARQLAAALRKAEPRRFGPTIAWFALALLLVGIVAGVPFLGGLLGVFLSVAGAGAIVLELHGRRMGPPAAAPAGAPMLSQAPGGG